MYTTVATMVSQTEQCSSNQKRWPLIALVSIQNQSGKSQARHTESETLVSRCTTEEIGEDQAVLLSETENGHALEHSEDILQDLN